MENNINKNFLDLMKIKSLNPYELYTGGAKKLGVSPKETDQIRKDVIAYTNEYYPDFSDLNESEKSNIMEALTHGLAAYRIGDTPVKRAAFQAKDISQAVGHGLFADRKFFKEELGDAVNNKVGFFLRQKHQNNEKEAVKELVNMINKKDKRLYFISDTNQKPISQLIGLNKIL